MGILVLLLMALGAVVYYAPQGALHLLLALAWATGLVLVIGSLIWQAWQAWVVFI
jgi:hypothetical protein